MDAINALLETRIKKGNQILFRKDDFLLFKLNDLLNKSNRQVIVLWALQLVKDEVDSLNEKIADQEILYNVYHKSVLWKQGLTKMKEAKQAILMCHSYTKNLVDPALKARVHAVGQGCSVIHTTKHALGLPLYQLSAIYLDFGIEMVHKQIKDYEDLLVELQKQHIINHGKWARFLAL